MTVIEEWLSQQPNLKQQCEKILTKRISDRTWFDWEKLVGAAYMQGQKVRRRTYTDEQTQLFLCLAWLRKHHPRRLITYKSLRDFYSSNAYKVEYVLDACCTYDSSPPQNIPTLVPLTFVKQCCDQILGRSLTRECMATWKQYLGIPKYSRFVEEGHASLLVYMACWRHDHPSTRFPSPQRLVVMMSNNARSQMTLTTNSSSKLLHRWELTGCKGKDLPKYLAAHGYRVATSTLYSWGDFHKRRHYSSYELQDWKRLAQEKKYGSA